MKNKFTLFLILGVMTGGILRAQSLTPMVIASSGGYFSSTAGSLSATVAEMTMVQTFASTGNFLTQGFQQPGEWFTSIKEEDPIQGSISVYPNPSNGKFNIAINSTENGKAEILVYDMMGQLKVSRQMEIGMGLNTENIDIGGYAMGIYFLEYIYTGNNGKKESKVFKISLAY